MSQPNPSLIAGRALLPEGWAKDVRIAIDERGWITGVEAGVPQESMGERVEGVVIPGVPNVHSHAFQRGLAGLAERRAGEREDTFWSWRELMYRFLGRLDPDDVEALAAQLYVEMLKAGYTAVGEFHYLHHDPQGRPYEDRAEMGHRVAEAARRAGIALTLLPAVYRTSDFGGVPAGHGQRRFLLDLDEALAMLEGLGGSFGDSRSWGPGPGRRLGLALHSLRAVPPEEVARACDEVRARVPAAPIHIHVAEQRREVEACLAWSGARPVAWLLDHAPVDKGWCLVHATHMDPEETLGLARSGAVAGLCPTTEANLGDGRFPLRGYLEEGGGFAVGSDSHVSVSPVEELRWLEYAQRLAAEQRNVAAGHPHASTARTLLEAAWAGGARALAHPSGALRAGCRADLVVLDGDHPLLVGRGDDAILDSWIFSGNVSPVKDVMVGGRWQVRDGRHPLEEETRSRFREVAERLAPQS